MGEKTEKKRIITKLAKEAKTAKVTRAAAPPPTPQPKKVSKTK